MTWYNIKICAKALFLELIPSVIEFLKFYENQMVGPKRDPCPSSSEFVPYNEIMVGPHEVVSER